MKCVRFMVLAVASGVFAQEPAAFQQPKAYDVQRYEAGWNKNPFTLKTAPTPVANAAFAKDLAIGAFYGAQEDPTIVLVNIKTHERIRLKKGQRTTAGITLNAVNLGISRSEATVEITSGDQAALVKFDEGYLKQVAATAAKPAPGQPPASPPVMKPMGTAAAGTTAASAPVANIAAVPEALRDILPASVFAASAPPGSAVASAPVFATTSNTAQPASSNSNTATSTPAGNATPGVRRRIITAVQR